MCFHNNSNYKTFPDPEISSAFAGNRIPCNGSSAVYTFFSVQSMYASTPNYWCKQWTHCNLHFSLSSLSFHIQALQHPVLSCGYPLVAPCWYVLRYEWCDASIGAVTAVQKVQQFSLALLSLLYLPSPHPVPGDDVMGDASDVTVAGEVQQLPIHSLQTHSQPQWVVTQQQMQHLLLQACGKVGVKRKSFGERKEGTLSKRKNS